MNPAVVADLEVRWRPLSGAQRDAAQALLDDAWAVLKVRAGALEANLADGSVSADLAVAVLCAMVLRVLRNPEGKRSETIDDYSWTRDNAVSAGLLYVNDAELDLLSPGGSSRAFTITPVGSDEYTQPDPWVNTTTRLSWL